MSIQPKAYLYRVQKLSYYLEREVYKILAREPLSEWDLSEIQSEIEQDWGIRPKKTTILKRATNFYSKHHIPFVYRAGFNSDKYKLNTDVDQKQLKAVLFPKRGRPCKYPGNNLELDEPSSTDEV